jgi:molybdopterin/thiamine biosynthesis adenylyltransferase
MMKEMAVIDRHSRQTIIPQIGAEGQKKLKSSHVMLLGCGALRTVIADALVRKVG